MELEHSFTVPVPKRRAWDVLLDVERVAPCMPGATLDSVDGDEIHGRIKVKVGPINMMYAGTARFIERDEEAGVVMLEASGKETKGAGTASASVRSVLEDRGDETHVTVLTTLNVTGKPAQFGRGVMNEVGGKLLSIFAANLATVLAEAEGQPAANGTTDREAAAASLVAAAATGPATAEPHAADAGSERPAAIVSAPIDELDLPVRVTSSLHKVGISTVGELATRTDEQLVAIDGIGPASIVEIKAKLGERGLTLGQPPTAAADAAAAAAEAATDASAGPAPGGPAPTTARQAAHQLEDDAINLLKVAGMPVLKRALPVLAGLTAALLIALRHRLRRRTR